MNESEIRQIIEEVDPGGKISQSTLEELVVSLSKNNKNTVSPVIDLEKNIKDQMELETDWRKKASLAAKIISLNLE